MLTTNLLARKLTLKSFLQIFPVEIKGSHFLNKFVTKKQFIIEINPKNNLILNTFHSISQTDLPHNFLCNLI